MFIPAVRIAHIHFFCSLLFCHFVFHFSCFICSALFTCIIAPCIPPFDDTRQVHISYGYTDRISLNKLKIIVWHHVSDFLFWSNSEIKWKILNTHATYSTHTAQLAKWLDDFWRVLNPPRQLYCVLKWTSKQYPF